MGIRSVQEALDVDYSLSITYLPNGQTVSFSGYMDSFKDTFTQNWSPEEVYGRMDPVHFYKSTNRKLSFAINVPADSEGDAIANFQKLQTLIKFSYPVYERESGLILSSQTPEERDKQLSQPSPIKAGNAMLLYQPPLIAVKFANLISSTGIGGKLIGKISEVSYTADNEMGYFSKNSSLIPKFFKLDFQMDVIHSSPLGWSKDEGGKIVWRDKKSNRFPYGV